MVLSSTAADREIMRALSVEAIRPDFHSGHARPRQRQYTTWRVSAERPWRGGVVREAQVIEDLSPVATPGDCDPQAERATCSCVSHEARRPLWQRWGHARSLVDTACRIQRTLSPASGAPSRNPAKMAVLVDEANQGHLPGPHRLAGAFHSEQAIAYGTQMVGGVTRARAGPRISICRSSTGARGDARTGRQCLRHLRAAALRRRQ